MKRVALGVLAWLLAASPVAPLGAQQALAGVRGEMLKQIDDAASKLTQLAQAIPQDKYGWRPGAGVRSISEVLLHVAGANYLLPTFTGVKSPVEVNESMATSMTDRTQVMDFMRRSFDHVRGALRALPDADLDKAATIFGQQSTNRDAYLTAVSHAHEHLGQLIAYARMNGIVPPWSQQRGQ